MTCQYTSGVRCFLKDPIQTGSSTSVVLVYQSGLNAGKMVKIAVSGSALKATVSGPRPLSSRGIVAAKYFHEQKYH